MAIKVHRGGLIIQRYSIDIICYLIKMVARVVLVYSGDVGDCMTQT